MSILNWGLGFGLGWGFIFWLISWTFIAAGKGHQFAEIVRVLYRGYDLTPRGAAVGTVWAVLDGFITGIIVGAIYHALKR